MNLDKGLALSINIRIAEKLTELYKAAKLLPKPVKHWDFGTEDWYWNYNEGYQFIIYSHYTDAFFYAKTTEEDYGSYGNCSYTALDGSNPIEYKTAIREVWSVLSEDEKTELMATVLGKTERGTNG